MVYLPRPAAIPATVGGGSAVRAWLQPSENSGNDVVYGTDGNLKVPPAAGKSFTRKLALRAGWTTDPARPLHITNYGSFVTVRGTVQRTVDPSYWNAQVFIVAEIPNELSPQYMVSSTTCGYHGAAMDGNSQVKTFVLPPTTNDLSYLNVNLLQLQDGYPDLPKDFWFPINLAWVI